MLVSRILFTKFSYQTFHSKLTIELRDRRHVTKEGNQKICIRPSEIRKGIPKNKMRIIALTVIGAIALLDLVSGQAEENSSRQYSTRWVNGFFLSVSNLTEFRCANWTHNLRPIRTRRPLIAFLPKSMKVWLLRTQHQNAHAVYFIHIFRCLPRTEHDFVYHFVGIWLSLDFRLNLNPFHYVTFYLMDHKQPVWGSKKREIILHQNI